jgi:hypothetical protein
MAQSGTLAPLSQLQIPPMTSNRAADISLRQAARIAGLGYLAIFLFSSYTDFAGVVSGDATASANNILANEVLFRSGIASWLIVFIADVVVAWALYVLLTPVNKTLSLLAAWLRLIYTAMAGMFFRGGKIDEMKS